MRCFVIRLVARAWGFSSRRDIVLKLWQKRKSYKLIQVFYTLPHFEMYLFVILSCDSAQGEKGTPIYGYRYVQPERVCFFLRHLGQKQSIQFGHFGLKLGMVLHFSLAFGMFSLFKRSQFFIIIDKTRNQTIVDKAGDPGISNFMIQGTKAGLRQGIHLRDRS